MIIHHDSRVYKRINGSWHVRQNGEWKLVTDQITIMQLNRLESMRQRPLFA